MPIGAHIEIGNLIYDARLKVAAELQHLIGTKKLFRSLKTKARRTANVRKLAGCQNSILS